MSFSNQTLLTPREVRQTRGLVIAFDLAFWAVILSFIALAIPIISLLIRSMPSDGIVTWIANQITPLMFWFLAASNAISVASAFLFLGAPARMRCFPEDRYRSRYDYADDPRALAVEPMWDWGKKHRIWPGR